MTENVPPRAWVEWGRKYMYANTHTYICNIHIFILFKGKNIRELWTFNAASPCQVYEIGSLSITLDMNFQKMLK